MKMEKSSVGLLILRLSIGSMLLLHGVSKLYNGIDWIKGILGGFGLPEFFAYGVYVGEVIATLLIIVGFRTKIGAILIATNMFVAVLLVHSTKIWTLTQSGAWGIELEALFFFGALVLFFTGGGKYALSNKNKWD